MNLLSFIDWWTLCIAALCAASCGMIGAFLVIRRLSLLGDAISHSVLPGLGAAFILAGTRSPAAMLAGALAAGVLTAALAAGVRRIGRLPHDAALGVVFTTFFAVGVLMVTWVAKSIDLDPSCVLYGLLELVSLDRVDLLGVSVPRALPWQVGLFAGNLLLIALLFKELRITSFDPHLATALGIHAGAVQAVLLTAVTATTVVSFEAVGSILVVALLVAPGATAQLLTDRLGRMVALSAVLGVCAAVLGYLGAVAMNTNIAGMIAVAAGAQFLFAAVFAPRYGVAARAIRHAGLSLRIAREDVLGVLYRLGEREAEIAQPTLQHAQAVRAAGATIVARLACAQLRRRGLVEARGDELTLTPLGFEEARRIVRAHRLWESYLSQNLPLPLDHLHDPSERFEHFMSRELQERVAAEVGTRPDPHGKQIPD
ncbi:MAG: metal ABC transporter permease [Phycisphaeraceae bacterium]|nr:metal ABC transporter permease [Phycisphaeraceae bacterium]